MYRSYILQRMVSTSHGQRRILKKSPPIQKYIRQAVESGTYYPSSQEHSENKGPRGSNFKELPIEYEILTLYPPIPVPPRLPKHQRGLRKKDSHVPTEKLVKDFLKRQQQQQQQQQSQKDKSQEEYYQTLLGIPPPSCTTAMGRKSALVNKAYAFALRQYQVMRQDDSITKEESIDIVNELLEKEHKTQRYSSRKTTAEIQQWRNKEKQSDTSDNKKMTAGFRDDTVEDDTVDVESSSFDNTTPNTYPSILYSKPRAIEGMALWSQRLKAVPYREWTIGATTALDHWIARSVLELEEDVWQELLEGETLVTKSIATDISAVRTSLFPETILDADRREELLGQEGSSMMEEEAQEEEEENDLYSSQDKSIDELLASLGGFDEDFEDSKDEDKDRFWPSSSSVVAEDDVDQKVKGLVNDLQNWRQKNLESPYEEWSSGEKDDFASWLDTYVETLASKREGEVDLDATRKALLESPPIDKDESDKFWQQVRDETEAEILLQSMKKVGVPPPDEAVTAGDRKAREAFALFQDLPYDVQVQKLVNLGTLRPILDEYTSESERVKFLARYGERLMEGVEMEHLVPDPEGPIRGDELGTWGEENDVGGDERFRMAKVAYGSDEFGNERSKRAREMYRAWNTHKAGRARFEELMFKKDRLGLRYNLDDKGKVHTTLQKELGK